jgi:hypothetical protein
MPLAVAPDLVDHSPDTPSERDRKAQDLAFAAGERRAEQAAINRQHAASIAELKDWGKTINGQIKRGVGATENLRDSTEKGLRELRETMEAVAREHARKEELRTAREEERLKIDKERNATLARTQKASLGKWERRISVAAIAVPTVASIAIQLKVF